MKKVISYIFLLLLNSTILFSQVAVNIDGSAPNTSAMVDVKSTTRGLLPPRVTHVEMNAISSPADGLVVYCTDCGLTGLGALCMFRAGEWFALSASCPNPFSPVSGTHVAAMTQVVWNWNTVPGATGYKWNTANNYTSATDMMTATTKTETGLTCNTAYTRYVWAYTSCGLSAPTTLSDTTLTCNVQGGPCPGTPTVTYGGKTYNTVLIDTHCWLKENLDIGTRMNGLQEQTNNAVIEKYCYDDLESNCDVYGGLYQWNEWMNYTASSNSIPSGRQGICPTGWHVPSEAEYCQMEIFLDPTVGCQGGWVGTDAGGKMKETGTSHWLSPNTGATNSSGFTGLPGGYRVVGGGFTIINNSGLTWSATESSGSGAWGLHLVYNNNWVGQGIYQKSTGYSGRCVKDF